MPQTDATVPGMNREGGREGGEEGGEILCHLTLKTFKKEPARVSSFGGTKTDFKMFLYGLKNESKVSHQTANFFLKDEALLMSTPTM